ncbi:hypothetical protein BDY19DRAFT_995489 [Irpex rosettiformis]|uniref:Uncharacterized protein n=1 Tax=Irpex rosettiformis TaxID=378272 RepID=A0ACB8TXK2_9APHY|nr:hypothetical protein BDY19DRAFT_995489 [Irpex rosettiformis]
MSGLSESDIQQLLLERTADYIDISAYGTCIAFSQEVEVIWRRKWSAMTWLYAFARYSEVLLCIIVFIPARSWEASQYMVTTLAVVQYFCLALFSSLRVYALLDDKIFVTGVVFFLNLVPVATNLFFCVTSAIVMDSEVCESVPTVSESVNLRRKYNNLLCDLVSLATRFSVIIGDVLVLLVTWSKTAKSYREARQLRVKAPLATLLFRDGTFYFMVLLIVNVLLVIEDNVPSLLTMQVSAPFFETLPPLIICRFILNLRQVKPAGSSWISGSQSGTHRFAGNAGESLQLGVGDEPEEEEENVVERSAVAEEPGVTAQHISDSNEGIAGHIIDVDASMNCFFGTRLVLRLNTRLKGKRGEDSRKQI